MADMIRLTDIPRSNSTEHDPTDDHALWLRLKPFIGHCLTMNHELNNSLTTVIGYAELMLEDSATLTDTQIEHAKAILEAAERLQTLVEALCREKIELSEQIDLGPVIDAYKKISQPLE